MSTFHVRQIQNHLRQTFEQHVDMSDVKASAPQVERLKHFTSRALASFALQMLCNLDAATAAARITDGGQDYGIDALHFDQDVQCLYVVQSKWHQNGNGTIAVGDTLKVIEGVKRLLSDESEDFGTRLKPAWQSVRDAFLSSSSATVVMCLAHSGSQAIHSDVLDPIKAYFAQVNDVSELIALRTIDQKELHDFIASGAQGKPVDLEVMLHDWGRVSQPFDAVFGRVLASDVASWIANHSRDRLLHQNIRKILPDSSINDSIVATLKETPQQFWYFNNGITVLADTISQKAIGAGTRDSGIFIAKNVSIVNGAQTAGAIARIGDVSILTQAHVQVRFISLDKCPVDFAKDVTRATNTQNRVESKDFASLDPVQERLRKELLVAGRQYLIKAGEKTVDPATQCTAEEAAIALSCAADVSLATVAKNSVGRIWGDSPEAGGKGVSIYRRVFPVSLDSTYLWNCVLALREVDARLKSMKTVGRASGVAVHGNRFVASQVFKQTDKTRLYSINFKVTEAVSAELVEKVVNEIATVLAQSFKTSYPGAIFKNQQKCQAIDALLAA